MRRFLIALITIAVFAQESVGIIKGSVKDGVNPLWGANIVVMGTAKGASTDADGNFIVPDVPAGVYNLRISYIGYQEVIKTDVIVRPSRPAVINIILEEAVSLSDTVVVRADFFSTPDEAAATSTILSNEELRRSPGSGGDLIRSVSSLPSISVVNEQKNTLIIRGGTPLENSFYIDNIPIPSINHFPSAGSSDGPASLINMDFVENVTLHSGGLSPRFPNALSSAMEIEFREGQRNGGLIDFSMIGLALSGEADIGDRTSLLVSARRSYYDLVSELVDVGASSLPKYWDFTGKAQIDIDPLNSLSILSITALDDQKIRLEDAIESGMSSYGPYDLVTTTAGINWHRIWRGKGYSETSLSHTLTGHDITANRTKYWLEDSTDHLNLDMDVRENRLVLRNQNSLFLLDAVTLNSGFEVDLQNYSEKTEFTEFVDSEGNTIPATSVNEKIDDAFGSLHLSVRLKPFRSLTLLPGISFNTAGPDLCPFMSMDYSLSPISSLRATAGRYSQKLPLHITAATSADLDNITAEHYILRYERLLTESTKLSIDLYNKEYSRMPVTPEAKGIFPLDAFNFSPFFPPYQMLESTGRARTSGVEILVQKKLAQRLYGTVSSSISSSRYRGYDGNWYDRDTDSRFSVNIEAGYKLSGGWDISGKLSIAGGRPYSPVNIDSSTAINQLVTYDTHKRFPMYHNLNIRVDKRFNWMRRDMTIYLSIWNVFNNRNILAYSWNEVENNLWEEKRWGLMPVIGIEYSF